MQSKRSRGYPAETGRSAEKIGELALRTRRSFCPHLRDDEAFAGIDVFESLHQRRVSFRNHVLGIDCDVKPLNNSLEAYTTFDPDDEQFVLCLNETTYQGLEIGEPRARFTLAHELGHLVMHRSELVALRALPAFDRLLARASVNHPIYRDTEWQADTFGSRLLVPDAGLRALALQGKLDIDHISSRFGVSHGAARVRLKQFLANREGSA